MGRLTTHGLDSAKGRPAADMRLELSRLEEGERTALKTGRTNLDGRNDEPLLGEDEFEVGIYEIRIYVGEFFEKVEAFPFSARSWSASASPASSPLLRAAARLSVSLQYLLQ